MKNLGIALFTVAAFTTATQAADLNWQNNAGTSPVFSGVSAAQWTGFYAGVSGGYGWGTTSSPFFGETNNNSDGWSLGGQAGYNMDMGGFVLGGEGDLQWSSLGYSEGDLTAKTDMFGTLRARAGIPIGQVMPYATLGVAYGRGSASVEDGPTTLTTTANHFGWTAGVGLEAQATSNLSLKAEYLYVDLGSQSYNLGDAGTQDIAQRFGIIRAGVNYKF